MFTSQFSLETCNDDAVNTMMDERDKKNNLTPHLGGAGVRPVTAGNVQMPQCQTKKMVYQRANFSVSGVTAESSRSNLDQANWFQNPTNSEFLSVALR